MREFEAEYGEGRKVDKKDDLRCCLNCPLSAFDQTNGPGKAQHGGYSRLPFRSLPNQPPVEAARLSR